jgi:hypothetical protein
MVTIDTRERVDERSLELILDSLGGLAIVVEQLPLARVEHESTDHEVDPGERHPVGDPVGDRSLADDGEWFVRPFDLDRTSSPISFGLSARYIFSPVRLQAGVVVAWRPVTTG